MDIRTKSKIRNRLNRIYKKTLTEDWIDELCEFIDERKNKTPRNRPGWDEKQVFLITYGDVIKQKGEAPLKTLHRFALDRLKGMISTIHILPFFPYSSDDGFSVEDFYAVNPELGGWDDIEKLEEDFILMADLVANHASSIGVWFRQFKEGKAPGKDYFFVPPVDFDVSNVIRPRSSPLLTPVETAQGPKEVWTTFSSDQVDLDYANPELLKEMLNVFLFYMEKGIRVVRLDAIAFLWKASGTSCMHEHETHEIVSLFRDVMDYCYPGALLLTETNVPHRENITYFGLGDEAHLIYQFALPPLILHALHTGNGSYLTHWAKELSDPRRGTTYLNFTSSHDGIGVRPLEGIMPDDEKLPMIEKLKEFGARVTTRQLGDKHVPYEINVTYFDALKGTKEGIDEYQVKRFLLSQTIMLSLQGVPAFYFLNLFGLPNDYEGLKETGVNRSINRRKFTLEEINSLLEDYPQHSAILAELNKRTGIRRNMIAFSPETQQLVIDLGNEFFCVLRKTVHMEDSVVCLYNLTNQKQSVMLPAGLMEFCRDVLTWELLNPDSIELKPYQSLWLRTRFML
ncbi:sugar phosphorylase [Mangrovibacterium lignilyticum]|uniref:sugar phosphorylase n=1 Tax=Mangrovibacterium lignilyticum TaxID=2668052 RepID=UPI0013D055EE|nr:sugar phosphorylase [Mangrovibacterium lignilyticum]